MMLYMQSLVFTIAIIISPSFPFPMLNRNDDVLDNYPSDIALSDTNAEFPVIDSIRIWSDDNQPPIDLNANFVLNRYPGDKTEPKMKFKTDLRPDDNIISVCSEGRIEINVQELASCLIEFLGDKNGNWDGKSKIVNNVEWKRKKRQMSGDNSTQNIQRIVQEIMNKRIEAKFNPTGW